MYLQSFSGVSIHIYTSGCRRESNDDRHTHTPMATRDLTCVETHTSRCAACIALSGALPLHTHTQK